MKIEEFKKYKRLVESYDPEMISGNEMGEKVYHWMESTGRIDEGIFSSIWSWLKRNFSPKARRIHALADEYGKELMAEGEAEYAKHNKADLAAKFRASTYSKLSRDYEERMDIEAEDDPDYKELVRILINKKNLEVKKALIKKLTGKWDPNDPIQKAIDKNDEEYERNNRKIKEENKRLFDKVSDFMKKKISDERAFFKPLGIVTDKEKLEFIEIIFNYTVLLREKGSEDLTEKIVYKKAREYGEFVKEMSKKYADKFENEEDAISEIKNTINSLIKKNLALNRAVSFEKLKSDVVKKIEETSSSSADDENLEDEVKDETTTDGTNSAISPAAVSTAVSTAINSTPGNPTTSAVVDEMEKEVKEFFIANKDHYLDEIKEKVEKFNAKSESEKKALAGKYEYALDASGNLALPKPSDIDIIMKSLIKITGLVVPYHFSIKDARISTMRFLFEIYAITKNADGDLKDSDVEQIVDNIKQKYATK